MWTSQYVQATFLSEYFGYVEKINHEIIKTLVDTNNMVIYSFILCRYTVIIIVIIIIIIIIIELSSSFLIVHTE